MDFIFTNICPNIHSNNDTCFLCKPIKVKKIKINELWIKPDKLYVNSKI
jgi:hypothetical protein